MVSPLRPRSATSPLLALVTFCLLSGASLAQPTERAMAVSDPSPARNPTMTQPSPSRGMKPSPPASTVEYQRIADRLAVLLNIHYSGQADLDFATLIKLLNEHAVALARVELTHGSAPAARQLAEQVIAHREQEAAAAAGKPVEGKPAEDKPAGKLP